MPFITSFTDETATVHPNSFWIIRYLSINLPDQYALLTYHGWHDVVAYGNRDATVGERVYNINDPTIFEIYFGQGSFQVYLPFYHLMDIYIQTSDDMFSDLNADMLSYMPLDLAFPFGAVEVGSQGPSKVIASWRGVISTTGSLTTGITIKINGTPATITLGTIAGGAQQIEFDITEVVQPTDEVTFEYNASGDLLGDDVIPLAPIIPITVVNSVGSSLVFSDPYNSGLALLIPGI